MLETVAICAVYNKALAFLRGTGAQSIHKCHPVGADPRNPNNGWCSDHMFWADPKGQHITTNEIQRDDGKRSVIVCLGDDLNTQRCYRDDGAVFDQHNDRKIDLWVTFNTVAGAWSERGKPLADLTPRAPNPPTTAVPSQPATAPSPPAAASVVPPKYNQIPMNYDEFAADYNKALAFLRDAETASIHTCFPAGSDPNDHRGWCQDVMSWVNDTGQHLAAVDTQRDEGRLPMLRRRSEHPALLPRRRHGNGSESQPKNQYLGHVPPPRGRLERTRQASSRPHPAREKRDQAVTYKYVGSAAEGRQRANVRSFSRQPPLQIHENGGGPGVRPAGGWLP
jgi:hypothetical protein